MPLSGNHIHIAPLGVEQERITKPLIEEQADQVILLEYIPPVEYPPELLEEIEQKLESESIEIEKRQANLEDLFDAVHAFAETIRTHATDNNDVFVNISSGNKIGAAGGLMACMESQVATPYYVNAKAGTSMVPDRNQIAEEVTGWNRIPLYPLDRPDEEKLRIMKFIAEADVAMRDQDEPFVIKNDLIKFGEEENLPFLRDTNEDTTNQAKHNSLRRNIIDPLNEEWGFIEIESVGSKHRIMLNEQGKNMLRAFEFLIE